MLSNRFQEDLLSAGTVIQSEMGGQVAGGGQVRGVCTQGGENHSPGAAHTGGWEETWGMLLCTWEEREGWQKEEESHESGWHLQKRMVAEGPLQRGSEGDEG